MKCYESRRWFYSSRSVFPVLSMYFDFERVSVLCWCLCVCARNMNAFFLLPSTTMNASMNEHRFTICLCNAGFSSQCSFLSGLRLMTHRPACLVAVEMTVPMRFSAGGQNTARPRDTRTAEATVAAAAIRYSAFCSLTQIHTASALRILSKRP